MLKTDSNFLKPLHRCGPWEMQSREPKDLPGGPAVKNPPSNAGDTGLIPRQGTKIPHAAGQLSPCAITTELARLN